MQYVVLSGGGGGGCEGMDYVVRYEVRMRYAIRGIE